MKENGYIRKIDELGRIVIPKELRKRLKIQEGENIIINCGDNNIKLTKYSHVENNEKTIRCLGDIFNVIYNYNIIITDLDNIIYSNIKFENNKLNCATNSIIMSNNHKPITSLNINSETSINGNIAIESIISSSTIIGAVIIYTDKKDDLSKFTKFISNIISLLIDAS